jgi:hypothetical protein
MDANPAIGSEYITGEECKRTWWARMHYCATEEHRTAYKSERYEALKNELVQQKQTPWQISTGRRCSNCQRWMSPSCGLQRRAVRTWKELPEERIIFIFRAENRPSKNSV